MKIQRMDSERNSSEFWHCLGKQISKSAIVFSCQVVLIYIVTIVSLVNLTTGGGGEGKVWIALLGSCIGYLLPNPSLKKRPV